MKKKYILNGKVFTFEQVQDAARQSGVDVSSYISKAGMQEVDDLMYDLGGKKFKIEQVAEAAYASNLDVNTYTQRAGFKKKDASGVGGIAGDGISPTPSKGDGSILKSTPSFTQENDWWLPKNQAFKNPEAISSAIRDHKPKPKNDFDFSLPTRKREEFRTKKQQAEYNQPSDGSILAAPSSPFQKEKSVEELITPPNQSKEPLPYFDIDDEKKDDDFDEVLRQRNNRTNQTMNGLMDVQKHYPKEVDINTILDNPIEFEEMSRYFEGLKPPERIESEGRGVGSSGETEAQYKARVARWEQETGKAAFNAVAPLVKQRNISKHVDDFHKGEITYEEGVRRVAKEMNPKGYDLAEKAKLESKGLDGINDQSSPLSILRGALDEILPEDVEKKNRLNMPYGEGEVAFNEMMQQKAMEDFAAAKQAGADPETLKSIAGNLEKYNGDVIYKYPSLVERKLTSELTGFIANIAGQMEGSETEDLSLKLFNDTNSKYKYAQKYLTDNGYLENPNTAEIAKEILRDIMFNKDKIGDASYLGGMGKSFEQPIVSAFKSLGDLTGFRKDSDLVEEKLTDQFFPQEVQGTKAHVSVIRNIANTTANVAAQALMQYATAGAARGVGMSKAAAQSSAFWASGSLPAYDAAYKESMDFIDNPAGRMLYAGAIGAFTGYTERLFKDIKLVDIPVARTAITELAQRAGTDGFTRELTDELLGRARSGVVDYMKKYASNVGQESAEEVAGQVFTDINKMIWGDPNTNMNDLMANAKDTFIQTAIGTSLIGGWGAYSDVRSERNTTYKSAIYNAAVHYDEAEDALRKGLHEGVYDQTEFDSKMQILNTAKKELADVTKVEKNLGKNFDDQQRQVYIANRVAEKVLNKQLEGTEDEFARKEIESKIKNLKSQRERIFNEDAKFDETLREVNEKEIVLNLEVQRDERIAEIEKRNDIDDDRKASLVAKEKRRHDYNVSEALRKANSIGKIGPAETTPLQEEQEETIPQAAQGATPAVASTTPVVEPPVRQPKAPVLNKKPKNILESLDRRVVYNGEDADLYQEGQTVIAETATRKYEVGNIDEIGQSGLADYGISVPEETVTINNDGTIKISGEDHFANPLEVVKDNDGNISTVSMRDKRGKIRKYSGQLAEDIAYQLTLRKITQDNGTQQNFEEFINSEPDIAAEINDAAVSNAAQEEAAGDNAAVQREAGSEPTTGTTDAGGTVTGTTGTQSATTSQQPARITTRREAFDSLTPDERTRYDELIENDQLDEAEDMLNEKLSPEPQPSPQQAATAAQATPQGISANDAIGVTDLGKRYQGQKASIIQQAARSLKAMRGILPDLQIIIHETDEEYMSATGSPVPTSGYYVAEMGASGNHINPVIHVNLSKAKLNTIPHEVAHAVMLKNFGNNTPIFKSFRDRISAIINSENDAALSDFANNPVYADQGEEVQAEEYLAELSGNVVASGATLKKTTAQKLAQAVNYVTSSLTNGKFKPFASVASTADVIDFFNTMFNALQTGSMLELREAQIARLNKIEPASSGMALRVDPTSFRATRMQYAGEVGRIGVYNDPTSMILPVRSLEDVVKSYDGRVMIITSDATGYGVDQYGELILGGFGFLTNKQNRADNIGFASVDFGTAKSTMTRGETILGLGKAVALIMVQPPSTTIGNSYGVKYFATAFKEIANSSRDLKKAKASLKEWIKNNKGIDNALRSVNTKRNKKNTEQALFNLIDSVNANMDIDQFVREFINDTAFDSRTGILGSIIIPTADTRTNVKTPFVKSAMKEAGFNRFDFLKKYGDNTILTDQMILDDIGGFVVGGFEVDIKDRKTREAETLALQEKGITHPLFNGKIGGTNAFVLDGLYDVNQNFSHVATPQTIIKLPAKQRDALVRKTYKDDSAYEEKHRSKPLEERTYTHLTVPKAIEFKSEILAPKGLVEESPTNVAVSVARSLGFPLRKGGAEELKKQRFITRAQAYYEETGIMGTDAIVEMVEANDPIYLTGVVNHIATMADRLKAGAVTVRDVAKAYLISIASVQSPAQSRMSYESKSGVTVPETFLDGENIRPESAMAYFLTTEAGARLLDEIDRGRISDESIQAMIQSSSPFGLWNSMDKGKAGAVAGDPKSAINLRNINEFNSILNKGVDNPDQLSAMIGKLKGVGQGKIGFVQHFLGLGNRGVIDAREIQAWLRGYLFPVKKDGTEKEIAIHRELTRTPNTPNPLQIEILKRIEDVGLAFGLPKDFAGYIGHHMIWDAVAGEQTSHESIYDVMRDNKPAFDAGVRFIRRAQVAVEQSNAVFLRDGEKPIGFNYNTDQVARERFDIPNLKRISAGSDRVVFDLGDRVLKIAKTARGLEQNVYEGGYDLVEEGIIPQVFERGLNYIVAEKVEPATGSNYKNIIAPLIDDLENISDRDFTQRTQKAQEILSKHGLEYVLNYDDMLWYDFNSRKQNWGVKDGKPIHLDGGTFGGVRMVMEYRGKKDMDDEDFRRIYSESKRLKKQFEDSDKFTRFQILDNETIESAKPRVEKIKRNPNEVRYNGRDVIGSRSRPQSEKDAGKKTAKEKLANPETNIAYRIADDYNESAGIPLIQHHIYKPSDAQLQPIIADTFMSLLDVTNLDYQESDVERGIFESYVRDRPQMISDNNISDYKDLVIKAYGKLIDEVNEQYRLVSNAIKIDWHFGDKNYDSSPELLDDIHNFGHMWVYRGGDDHSMLGSSTLDENGLTANDKFRAVHDFFGHGIEGYQFGKDGEENAWIEHSKMFSPLAQLALSSETRGQNSVVNYSGINEVPLEKIKLGSALKKKGQSDGNPVAILEGQRLIDEANNEFQFAEQKAIVLPSNQTNASRYITRFQAMGRRDSTESPKQRLDRMLAEGTITQAQYDKKIAKLPQDTTQSEEVELDAAIRNVNVGNEKKSSLSIGERISNIVNPTTDDTETFMANDTLKNAGYISGKGRPAQYERTTIAMMTQSKMDFIEELRREEGDNAIPMIMEYFRFSENHRRTADDINVAGISTAQNFQMVNVLLSYIHNSPISELGLSPEMAFRYERYLGNMKRKLGNELGKALNVGKLSRVDKYLMSGLGDDVIESVISSNDANAIVEAEEEVLKVLAGEAGVLTDEELLAQEEAGEELEKESGTISKLLKLTRQKEVSEKKSKKITEMLKQEQEKVKELFSKLKCD
jgi:hypothetical protein